LGADVEQDVARRGDSVPRPSPELAKRVQLGRACVAEKPVPDLGAERRHAGKSAFEVAKPDRAQQCGEVRA